MIKVTTVQMAAASILKAVEVSLEAHAPFIAEQLQSGDKVQVKLGRGGCGGKKGYREKIDRPRVHIVKPETDTGSHSTNEGCLPSKSRIVMIGDCPVGDDKWQNAPISAFKDDSGFTYDLLKKAEDHGVAYLKGKYGADKVRNIANGNQGREQYGPQRYLYINIIDKVRAQQIASEHFKQGKPRKRKRIDENSDSD